MIKTIKILVLFLFTIQGSLFITQAQVPGKISYQAVIRNSSNAIISNTQIGMEINIRKASPTGTLVYAETKTPTTNANGIVSIEIGNGIGFDSINWGSSIYFIETKIAVVAPLTTYTITNTSQLLSVSYALHAKTADSVSGVSAGAEVNVNADWNATSGDAQILNKPTILEGTMPGQMQYWNGIAWLTVEPGGTGQVLTFVNGVPVWVGPVLTNVAINPTTGKIWMDRNLGATQVATSSTDASSYGDLYQWGRSSDGHQVRSSVTTTTLSSVDVPGYANFILTSSVPNDWRSPQNSSLWQGANGINNPCPKGYRVPTDTEFEEESNTWSAKDAAGAYASSLKLPVAGFRNGNTGALNYVSVRGYYWSSTVNGISSNYMVVDTGIYSINPNTRNYGFSVRCIKN
ncbi:MAG: FISUMP domain-containing protein [Bacteroidota bacterium]